MRVSQDTDHRIKTCMPLANCQSQNEFVEKALRFYCEYLTAQDSAEMLPSILVSALRATIQNSESRTARLLFKLAVEVSMMAKVLALGLEIDPKELDRIRGQCVQQVKSTNGSISFKEAIKEEWAK